MATLRDNFLGCKVKGRSIFGDRQKHSLHDYGDYVFRELSSNMAGNHVVWFVKHGITEDSTFPFYVNAHAKPE